MEKSDRMEQVYNVRRVCTFIGYITESHKTVPAEMMNVLMANNGVIKRVFCKYVEHSPQRVNSEWSMVNDECE